MLPTQHHLGVGCGASRCNLRDRRVQPRLIAGALSRGASDASSMPLLIFSRFLGRGSCQLTTVDTLVVIRVLLLYMDKKSFSVVEVAKILGITRQAILKKIKAGEIKSEKVGRSYVIQKANLPILQGGGLTDDKKDLIRQAVKKTIQDYGETLKMLGKE